MNTILKLTLLGTMIVSISAGLAWFVPKNAMAGQSTTITARVTSNCSPVLRTFTIPAGKTAFNFSIDGFASGVSCGTGAEITESGFDIHYRPCPNPRTDGDVYWYRKNRGSSTSSSKLSELDVSEGTYCLSFDGGRDGYVRLRYELR